MKILGIESAAMTASAALLQDDVMIAEYTVNFKQTHSQTLLPMIDEIIRMTQTDIKSLDAIAVSAGPGSYTGLRIGSATAKGLGLALGIPLISVPTLAAMAYQCWGSGCEISPVMDARRGQVYTALYRFDENGELITCKEPQVILMEQWMKELKNRDGRILFTGDAVSVFKEQIQKTLPGSLFAPAHMNRERAGAVAALGAVLYAQGKTETAAEHLPVYLRKPQAEREREAQMEKGASV